MSEFDAILTWLNSGVCSQNPAHSFSLAGRPLPLCARDLGLFCAFFLASCFVRRGTLVWLLGLLPFVVDGLNSLAGSAFYEPNNLLRLATGVLAGLCLAKLLGQVRPPPQLLPLLPITLGTVGVLSLLASSNLLTGRFRARTAWLLALPELAALAAIKQGALALVLH